MAREKKYVVLGSRIRRAREDAGMTRERLAVAVDASYSSIVNWELGEQVPRFDVMTDIARVTAKELEWFASSDGDDDDPADQPRPAAVRVKNRRRRAADQGNQHSPCNLQQAA